MSLSGLRRTLSLMLALPKKRVSIKPGQLQTLRIGNTRRLPMQRFGYSKLDRLGSHLFFELVSKRYRKGEMILTSNKSYAAWGDIFRRPYRCRGDSRSLVASLAHNQHTG